MYIVWSIDAYLVIEMCTTTNVRQYITPWSEADVYCAIETKNTWARDDPAILILLFASLSGEVHSDLVLKT